MMQRIFDFLTRAGYYYLATVDGNKPCLRPFGSALLFDGRLYFCTGNFKDVYDHIKTNPHIAISALDADGSWLRISGEAVFDGRPEPAAAMYEQIPSLHDIYDGEGIDMVLCYIQNGYAQFNRMDGTQETFAF